MRKIVFVAALMLGLALGGCAKGVGPGGEGGHSAGASSSPIAASGRPVVAPTPGRPATLDEVTRDGCATMQLLGSAGTPEQYRAVSATLSQSPDSRVAAAAIALHDATGNSLEGANRLRMVGAVLDLDEECLRVTG